MFDGIFNPTSAHQLSSLTSPAPEVYITGQSGDTVFFTGTDQDIGYELWRSDGSEANTRMVADLFPGSGPANPQSFHLAGDQLFFVAFGEHELGSLYALDHGINPLFLPNLFAGEKRNIYPGGADAVCPSGLR